MELERRQSQYPPWRCCGRTAKGLIGLIRCIICSSFFFSFFGYVYMSPMEADPRVFKALVILSLAKCEPYYLLFYINMLRGSRMWRFIISEKPVNGQ
jgi:hypothetical protein